MEGNGRGGAPRLVNRREIPPPTSKSHSFEPCCGFRLDSRRGVQWLVSSSKFRKCSDQACKVLYLLLRTTYVLEIGPRETFCDSLHLEAVPN